MFGLPPGSSLAEVVHELTATHIRTVGELSGPEPPLLQMLERAIASDTSGASGSGGGTRSGAPVDVIALTLWTEISQCVGEHWPYRGDLSRAGVPLSERLVIWTQHLAGSTSEVHLLEMCLYWRKSIRDLLEPPKSIPLRGHQCPKCRKFWAASLDSDGRMTWIPAILVHLSEDPVRAECRSCDGEWRGGELVDLGALQSAL
jgi:hypothetical protein